MSASLQACGVVFPFAISTSICRSKFTICSGLYLFIGMTGLPPGEFSLISPGTKIPGQVTSVELVQRRADFALTFESGGAEALQVELLRESQSRRVPFPNAWQPV